MCSLLCLISKEQSISESHQSLFKNMLVISEKRGPDSSDIVFIEPNILFGSNRLSIQDLSYYAKMPMVNSSQTVFIIYNGEIYNHKKLRRQLETKGYQFKTGSDTEVALHAYEEWGENCVDYFNGMFAFVIWDKKLKKLFAARDRLGIKPLYLWENHNYILLSSDLRAILPFPEVKKEIDPAALTAYMHFRFVPGEKTIFQGITKINPAEKISWDFHNHTNSKSLYWKPQFKPNHFSEEKMSQNLFTKIKEGIDHCLVSDVPVGILLSGGIDSATLIGMIDKLGINNSLTFSCIYGRDSDPKQIVDKDFSFTQGVEDESYYSSMLAKRFNTRHRILSIDEDDIENSFNDMIYDLEEPLASTDAIGHYLFARKLSRYVKVAISGTGSDEFLGGYVNMYFKNGSLLRNDLKPLDYLKIFSNLDNPSADPSGYLADNIIDNTYCYELVKSSLGQFPIKKYPKEKVNEHVFFELFFDLPGWELNLADKMYMASSVELRPAFLDNDFVDYALTIPSKYKYYKGEEKYILRKAVKDIVPTEIWQRRKYPGLVTPRKWYEKKWFMERLNALKKNPVHFWNIEKLNKLINKDPADLDFDLLYRIVVFESWYKIIFEEKRFLVNN